MKRIAILAVLFGLGLAPAMHAQDHGEVGAFADYFRANDSNFLGVGGRVSVNVQHYVQLEGEMNYDFAQAFTEGFTNPNNSSVTFQQSDLRILHGMFGPKLQTGGGHLRAFVTVKGGFDNFYFTDVPPSFNDFASSVGNLRTNNVDAVLYPGGGVEAFAGPFGVRLDVGDEIVFINGSGAHHNLRVTVGPTIRF